VSRRDLSFARFFRFAAMGLIGMVLSVGITAFVHEVLGISEELAFAVALASVVSFHFMSGRYVIYGAAAGDPKRQLLRFGLATGGFRAAEYLGFLVLHTLIGVPYLLVIVIVLGSSFIAKFFFYGRVVFTGGKPLPP
jgi:putative flippase GtrA